MNLKLTGFIFVLCFVFGAGFYFANETNAQEKTYQIGDRGPAGGWIFYDKGYSSDGWRYLEAAPEDQTENAEWGCYTKTIPGSKGTAVGTGKSNTHAIIKSCSEANIAAKVAAAYRGGGKSDWFLPSKDELNLMYRNLHLKGVGGFTGDYYWSSSEDKVVFAWIQVFYNGNQYSTGKKVDYVDRVRVVRAFGGLSAQTASQEESREYEIRLPNGELPFGVDYSGYDTLTKLKAKNPDITFSQIKYPYDAKGRTQFKTVLGQSPITTEASFTFNSKGHLVGVIIKKKGAALNVYEPLFEKYTVIYGDPESSIPFMTDLRQNCAYATSSWKNDNRNTRLLLVVPFDNNHVPSLTLFEFWKGRD